MHRPALTLRRPRQRGEDGVVAIIVALCMTLLCVATAMVLDFGLIKVDRQVHKSDADAAVIAGMRAMDFTGGSSAQPVRGICAALHFLKASDDRFAGLPETGSAFTDGTANPVGAALTIPGGVDCTNPASPALSTTCSPTVKSSWVQYNGTVTADGEHLTVHLGNGYDFWDSSSWSEDTLGASSGVNTGTGGACMDMELTITESRQPGLGSLATDSDLTTAIRTVGRVTAGTGKDAPAMLLLKQHGCAISALMNGGSGFIHVKGVATAAGVHTGGTIHSDDDGSGCGTGGTNQIMYGRSAGGIAAYAAPSCPTCTTPDTSKPGSISSVAGTLGVAMGWIVDSTANVYGASGTGPSSPGTTTAPIGRALVTRQPVDVRYKSTIQSIVSTAQSSFTIAAPAAGSPTWATTAACSGSGVVTLPTAAAELAKPNLWINCGNAKSLSTGSGTIGNWSTVVFSGDVTPGSAGFNLSAASTVIVKGAITASTTSFAAPVATKMYVLGGTHAITVSGGGGSFQMHTSGRTGAVTPPLSFPDAKQCVSTNVANTNRALLVVKNGDINSTALFRACDTTVVMLGNDPNLLGCVPTYNPVTATSGPAPTTTPCPSTDNSGKGTGQVNMNGDTDWTAPSACTVTSLVTGCDGTVLSPAPWSNPNGPEDLALWSESYATSSGGTTSRLGGSANVNVRGVYMTPNFDPMVFGGGGTLNLTNAQFVAASLNLNGSTLLTMSVDPNSAVTIPSLSFVGLVR